MWLSACHDPPLSPQRHTQKYGASCAGFIYSISVLLGGSTIQTFKQALKEASAFVSLFVCEQLWWVGMQLSSVVVCGSESLLCLFFLTQVKYRAQRHMTQQAVLKMVAVWVLAFLLYGPAIIFWENIVGQSVVPPHECFAEFYFTWYFLLSASTFEFFAPFVSVAFFNLSIYLNIHRRNKEGGTCAEDDTKAQKISKKHRDGVWSVFFMKTRKVSCSEPTAISAVIEEDVPSPCSSQGPNSSHILMLREKSSPDRRNSRLFQHTASGVAPDSRTQRSHLSRDKKIAKSLAIIVCIFGICWAPYTLLMIIRAACSGSCVANYWYDITFWLLWLNSAINPFLYPLCHSSFRRAFSKILCPKRQSVQPQIEVQSC